MGKIQIPFKGNDIFFTNNMWNDKNLSFFTRIGTRFGTIGKNNKIQLHSFAAQHLYEEIGANIYQINNIADLRTYIAGGTIKTGESPNSRDVKVIKYQDMILGTEYQYKMD